MSVKRNNTLSSVMAALAIACAALLGCGRAVAAHGGIISAGSGHSCAVVGGGLQCWGDNSDGMVGDGSLTERRVPVVVYPPGYGVVAVAAGGGHTCAVLNGGLDCWGYNNYSQLLGNVYRNYPIPSIASGSGVTGVAAGGVHTCVLIGGGVQCWGDNYWGQLGNGSYGLSSQVAVQPIAAGSGVIAVAAGGSHTCALVGGGVRCWGKNSSGQIGNGTNTSQVTVPTQVIAAGSSATDIAAGADHTCAVVNGGVQCWGANNTGQIGNGVFNSTLVKSPLTVIAAGSGATAVSTGNGYTCAVVAGGIKCWGYNEVGSLGSGSSIVIIPAPVQTIAAGSGATAVATGGFQTLAVVGNGVQAWGMNWRGELGINRNIAWNNDGLTTNPNFETLPARVLGVNGDGNLLLNPGTTYPVPFFFSPRVGVARGQAIDSNPVAVNGITGMATVTVTGGQVRVNNGAFAATSTTASNGDTVTARVTAAAAYETATTVNVNIGGRTGTFSATTRASPAVVPSVPALAMGEDYTLILSSTGLVFAAGNSVAGQMGNGSTLSATRYAPVAGLAGIKRIAAGGKHALAVATDGTVFAWGYNAAGQLGAIGAGISSDYPLPAAITSVEAIAAGQHHSLALKTDKTVWTWGLNTSTQLGGDCTTPTRSSPAKVTFPLNVTAIAAGANHSLAITSDGAMWVWGANASGQLGDGTTVAKCAPVKLLSIANVIAVAAGAAHTLALTQSGALYAWGTNAHGQVGNATNINAVSPVLIGSGFTGVAAGGEHSFALKLGGVAFAWGANDLGQLGDGTLINRNMPTALAEQSGYVAMAAGARHSGAITRFGEVLLWGYNASGQLGNRVGIIPPGIEPVRGTVRIQTVAGSAGSSTQRTSQTGTNRLILKDLDYFEGDFGVHPLSEIATRTYVFANQEVIGSGNDINGLGISLSGAGFSLSGNTCMSVLLAGTDCAFNVSFQPPAPGDSTGAISIASNTASGIEPYTVLGTGIAPATPAMTLSDKFLLYASRKINTTSEAENILITNTGSAALASLLLTSSTAEFAATHNCPAQLAVNASCTVNVTFAPAQAGAREATLTLQSNAGSAAVSLSGIGAESIADIDPAPFVFINQIEVQVATPRTSNTITVSAIDAPAPIWVAGGTYAINGGAFTQYAGTVTNNQTVQVRHVSGAVPGTVVETTLSVGNRSAKFRSTSATEPAAPVITSVVAGNQSVTINFTVPNDGGSAITSYTATGLPSGIIGTCNVPCSSIIVTGLMNGTSYTFTLTATNAIGTGGASVASMPVTPALVTLSLSSVVSRKIHGAAGPFDIPVLAGLPVSIEPRMSSTGHQIIFQFNMPVTATGTLSAIDQAGLPAGVSFASASGNEVSVWLAGVADNSRVTLMLAGVNGTGFNVSATVGFLAGDVNASGKVSAGDIASVKARAGIPLDGNNFRADVNASGDIDAADSRMAKARAGLQLP